MKTIGITAEYNPFHRGHVYQIEASRQRFPGEETAVLCVMSGPFVQRGDWAILDKWARAEAALLGGADLVLELPLAWSLSSAEGFARGAVSLMEASGVVDVLSFGSEGATAEELTVLAKGLASAEFSTELKSRLERGLSFPAAREQATERLWGKETAALLAQPNQILGLEYCKALLELGSAIRPMAIPRKGVGHDAAETDGGYASASELRRRIRAGEEIDAFLTQDSLRILERERAAGRAPVTGERCETAVLARLRSMTEADYLALPDSGEGLHRRLMEAGRKAGNLQAALDLAGTRRYPEARLRRMLLRAYLNAPAQPREQLPPYLRVLGANQRGQALLKQMKERATLPILTKPAHAKKLEGEALDCFLKEVRATDLYSLAFPGEKAREGGREWTRGPVIL